MKTKLLFNLASLLGAAAIVWMGADFVGGNALALLVTGVIGCVYALGLAELLRFRRDTGTLAAALQAPLKEDLDLDAWLGRLPVSLRAAVGQRIQGERVGLPAPVFAPYLVGLLVMLGLLGTFVGMVETLQGAVLALEGSTELAAIRQGLAAPIQGLSLAFGTSVAGIAASAMLGLNATLSRRERVQVTRELDRLGGGPLRQYSLAYNRQLTYTALQQQADALPQVAARLEGMAGELEQLGKTLGEQLLDNQRQFLQGAETRYEALAESVGESLRASLADSSRLAGESIAPAVAQTLQALGEHGLELHRQLREDSSAHLDAVSERLDASASKMVGSLEATGQTLARDAHNSAGELVREIGRLLASTESLVEQRAANEARWLDRQEQQMGELSATLGRELATLREEEAARQREQLQKLSALQTETAARLEQLQAETVKQLQGLEKASGASLEKIHTAAGSSLERLGESIEAQLQALASCASEQLAALESGSADNLARLGRELEAPMTRLIETASESPRAAAEVIGKLREELANNLERDNSLLEERARVMQDLTTLTATLKSATEAQAAAIGTLIASSSGTLQSASEQFSATLSGEAERLSEITADVADSAADMASLGEAFGLAVQLYSESNRDLVDNLSRIEASMEKSTERSDEQMSYYVAQAREIIDQSMLSQREIIEELRRLGQTGDLFTAEAG